MEWIDINGVRVRDMEAYIAPDGTLYPPDFPRASIPWLTVYQPTAQELKDQSAAAAAKFQSDVIASVQQHLDNFARTRNYDGILSACTYATSTVDKFKAEGQYCVDIRDLTWATLYSLMADVQAGTRTMPDTVDAVLALLPTPTWPA